MKLKQVIELLRTFIVSEFKSKHRGSALGFLWLLLTPCFLLIIYTFVFGVVFDRSFEKSDNSSIFDYAVGLFVGISIFQIFANAISGAPQSIISRPNFIKKIQFPLHILPISSVFSGVIIAALNLVICIVLSIYSSNTITWSSLILIPILIISSCYAIAIALFLSALSVYLRDVIQLSSFCNLALMFSSGIFYLPEEIPAPYYDILKFNPLVHLVDVSRRIILWNEPINLMLIFYLFILGVLALIISYKCFNYMKTSFSDAI